MKSDNASRTLRAGPARSKHRLCELCSLFLDLWGVINPATQMRKEKKEVPKQLNELELERARESEIRLLTFIGACWPGEL